MRECTPLTNSSSLDKEANDIIADTLSTPRFSFIERLLSNVKAKRIPQKLSLQPINQHSSEIRPQ